MRVETAATDTGYRLPVVRTLYCQLISLIRSARCGEAGGTLLDQQYVALHVPSPSAKADDSSEGKEEGKQGELGEDKASKEPPVDLYKVWDLTDPNFSQEEYDAWAKQRNEYWASQGVEVIDI